MANELTISVSLSVRGGNVVFRFNNSFRADMASRVAPSPGGFDASPSGTDVDLSELTDPGWSWIANVESDGGNRVRFGIWDPEQSKFYPFADLDPGEAFPLPMSRALLYEYGTGTGTVGGATNTLRVYSLGGTAAQVYVGAMNR